MHPPNSNDKIFKGGVHPECAHLRKSCTRPRKCAHRVQGAPLISDTGSKSFSLFIKVNFNIDYFSIYIHLFGGNLSGGVLKLTQCELVLDLVK